jgi:hypothetical protein
MRKVGFVGNVWVSMNKVVRNIFFAFFYKGIVKEIVSNNKLSIVKYEVLKYKEKSLRKDVKVDLLVERSKELKCSIYAK